MNSELAIVTEDGEVVDSTPRAPMTLFGTDDPTAVVERASAVATALASVIAERRLFTSIGNKKHVQVEGWTLLGSMLGVFAEVQWSRPLDNGWEARAVARTLDGRIVGAAEAMCTVGEGRWKSADPYAVRSMAQTRAVSKALRLPLGFIMHLAGYSATPAEELTEDQPERSERASSVRREDSKPATTSAPAPRTPEENALLDQIAEASKRHGVGHTQQRLIAKALGLPPGERANADQLRAILERIESPGSGVPTASPALDQPSATDGDGAAPVARGGESSESPPPTAGPEGAVSPSLPSGPALDPQALLESAQAIVGGEIVDVVPPELQARIDKARAKGKAKPEPETLAEQLRVEAS
jgi:hypothetical protein